jgi:NAD-dependent SIR2 family protein deacetylase
LADLEKKDIIKAVITQNVDTLHEIAGSKNVTHLHGRNDRLVCLSCGTNRDRLSYQEELEDANFSFLSKLKADKVAHAVLAADHSILKHDVIKNSRPDGDTELGDIDTSEALCIFTKFDMPIFTKLHIGNCSTM